MISGTNVVNLRAHGSSNLEDVVVNAHQFSAQAQSDKERRKQR